MSLWRYFSKYSLCTWIWHVSEVQTIGSIIVTRKCPKCTQHIALEHLACIGKKNASSIYSEVRISTSEKYCLAGWQQRKIDKTDHRLKILFTNYAPIILKNIGPLLQLQFSVQHKWTGGDSWNYFLLNYSRLLFILWSRPCLVPIPHPKFHYAKRRFPITSKYRQMHGVLNVDKIKN
jgi:hypothetical protein